MRQERYFIEMNGRFMYIEEPEFGYDFVGYAPILLADGHAKIEKGLKTPVKIQPQLNTIMNPFHKIFKENFDELDAAITMKIRKHTSHIFLPQCSIGIETNINGVITSYTKYKIFQVQVQTLSNATQRQNFYLLGFRRFNKYSPQTNEIVDYGSSSLINEAN